MLFNSSVFIFFSIIFFVIWNVVKNKTAKSRYICIIIASLIFYGWWDWRFVFLIIFSGFIDFFSALAIKKYRQPQFFLYLSLAGNIGSLCIFKYSTFIAQNVDFLLSIANFSYRLSDHIPEFTLILPVGISFYTFQSMSYTIDVYKEQIQPTTSMLHFFAYLCMFPQLVAGPIVRASEMLPQLEKQPNISKEEQWQGCRLIVYGFFKKVVIADNLAVFIDKCFDFPGTNGILWWIVIAMFALQIYSDFSGYSDIARGLARWMGYYFDVNFRNPYISTSIKEFWSRWHISLSTWFRDYVYIPLGGSQTTRHRIYINIYITMLISGIWHGTSWNFFIWGALHATFLSLERMLGYHKILLSNYPGRVLCWMLLLIQVLIGWVFFRAESFEQATFILYHMFDFSSMKLVPLPSRQTFILLCMAILGILHFHKCDKVFAYLEKWEPEFLAFLVIVIIFFRGPGSTFIYFQF